jgi:hypothetical protein
VNDADQAEQQRKRTLRVRGYDDGYAGRKARDRDPVYLAAHRRGSAARAEEGR